MVPQLVMGEGPYVPVTLLDPLGGVKCAEGAAKAWAERLIKTHGALGQTEGAEPLKELRPL